MFQLLNPKVEQPPHYFPMRLHREMPEKTSELPSRPEEMHPYLTCDQPTLSMTPKPCCPVIVPYVIHNLYAIRVSLFFGYKLSISKVANSVLNYFFFLYCKLQLGHFFVPVHEGRRT